MQLSMLLNTGNFSYEVIKNHISIEKNKKFLKFCFFETRPCYSKHNSLWQNSLPTWIYKSIGKKESKVIQSAT